VPKPFSYPKRSVLPKVHRTEDCPKAQPYCPKRAARIAQGARKGLVDATRLARGAFTKLICRSIFLAVPKPFSYPKRAARIALRRSRIANYSLSLQKL